MIHYFSNGSKAYAKERIEVYSHNRTAVIDNFRKLELHGFKSKGLNGTQDKGHKRQFELFVSRLRQGGAPLIPFESLMNTSRAAIAAVRSLKTGKWEEISNAG